MSDLINYNKIILQKHNQMKNDFNYIKKFILKKLFYSKENQKKKYFIAVFVVTF